MAKAAINKSIEVSTKEELNEAMDKLYRTIHVKGSVKHEIYNSLSMKKSTNLVSKMGVLFSIFVFWPAIIPSLIGLGYSAKISKYKIIESGSDFYLQLK